MHESVALGDRKSAHCTQSSEEEDLLALTLAQENVNVVEGYQNQIFALMNVGGKVVKFQVDAGAIPAMLIRQAEVPSGVKIRQTPQSSYCQRSTRQS